MLQCYMRLTTCEHSYNCKMLAIIFPQTESRALEREHAQRTLTNGSQLKCRSQNYTWFAPSACVRPGGAAVADFTCRNATAVENHMQALPWWWVWFYLAWSAEWVSTRGTLVLKFKTIRKANRAQPGKWDFHTFVEPAGSCFAWTCISGHPVFLFDHVTASISFHDSFSFLIHFIAFKGFDGFSFSQCKISVGWCYGMLWSAVCV